MISINMLNHKPTANSCFSLGVVHKRRQQSWGRGLSALDSPLTPDFGSSDADVRTVWCKKLRIFRKFMVCPHGQGGGRLSQCGHFANKEEGQFFAILCGLFYGRLLGTFRWIRISQFKNPHIYRLDS